MAYTANDLFIKNVYCPVEFGRQCIKYFIEEARLPLLKMEPDEFDKYLQEQKKNSNYKVKMEKLNSKKAKQKEAI